MTRLISSLAGVALAASLAGLATPASAEPAGRAVDQCRAELIASFPADAIRSHRVLSIDNSSSRRTEVSFSVTADRRYRFECTVDSRGRIVTAAFSPARSAQLAAQSSLSPSRKGPAATPALFSLQESPARS